MDSRVQSARSAGCIPAGGVGYLCVVAMQLCGPSGGYDRALQQHLLMLVLFVLLVCAHGWRVYAQ